MSNISRFVNIGRKIIGVGRNYKDHALELGNEVPTKPLLFMKPTSSYITAGDAIEIPMGSSELHHEIELGVIIGSKCKKVTETEALSFIGGYALALDMTCRDFQSEAKAKGHPWIMAKCFDTACPISDFIPIEYIPDPHSVSLQCSVNGSLRQNGNTKDMVFSIPYLIHYISKYFTLEKGDVILTGTPSGVGPVKEGDIIEGSIPGIVEIRYPVISRI